MSWTTERLKAYFEGETRDLERKLGRLDGQIDQLTNQQRFVKFGVGIAVAFEAIENLGPIVAQAYSTMTNAAIEHSPYVDQIRKAQSELNDEWVRTQTILGGALLGDMSSLEARYKGVEAALRGINDLLDDPRLLQVLGGTVFGSIPTGIGRSLAARGRQAMIDERTVNGFYTLDEQVTTAPRPPRRPQIPNAPLEEEGGPFAGLQTMVRDRRVFGALDEMGEKVDTVAHSFSRAELASAQWGVTMAQTGDMATASLQAHLQAQLRFENVKKASGKRIVQSVLADIGSQALAESVYQAALAVGYLFINPAKAASHAQSAVMLGAIAGGAALGYSAFGGSFEQSGPVDAGLTSAGGSRTDRGGSASARAVAAGSSIGTINFNLTFIYNGNTYYVGPGGMEQFVGEIVPLLNERVDSGELRATA